MLDHTFEAVEIGLSCPIKLREWAAVIEEIFGGIFGHIEPIDAPDILAPAENLPDKPFSTVKRSLPLPIRLFNAQAYFARKKETAVEILREEAVKEKRFTV